MQATASKTLINRKKLLAMIPLSERTIFNMEQRGEFPRRIALTSRNVAWDLAEVEEWIEARRSSGIAGRCALYSGYQSSRNVLPLASKTQALYSACTSLRMRRSMLTMP